MERRGRSGFRRASKDRVVYPAETAPFSAIPKTVSKLSVSACLRIDGSAKALLRRLELRAKGGGRVVNFLGGSSDAVFVEELPGENSMGIDYSGRF